MHQTTSHLHLAATDLANHLACSHLTSLNHQVAQGTLERPFRHDPMLDRLRQRGIDHEKAYVDSLRAQGLNVVEISSSSESSDSGSSAEEQTRAAMQSGADVIVQAALRQGDWRGLADVLRKVPCAASQGSTLGDWLYEVEDTKLATETKGSTVLQLCVYADLLASIQGVPSPRMHVVTPGDPFGRDIYRFEDFQAYYRTVKVRLEQALAAHTSPAATDTSAAACATRPEPVPHCDYCNFRQRCRDQWRDEDHLSLVAGMTRLHADELRRQGVARLDELAVAEVPLPAPPRRGRLEAYVHLQEQARVQKAGRDQKRFVTEYLRVEPERGFLRLPAPDAGDIFLDFESDAHAEEGGLEYLLGYALGPALASALAAESGERRYSCRWALSRREEKEMLEEFLDFVHARLRDHPALHIYHFAPYEVVALRRLCSRHATRQLELDWLLRNHRFVDLHAVVRQSLRVSVESYSLKQLEPVFGYEREVKLREEANPALQRVAAALEFGVPQEIAAEDRQAVEGYNRDDCLSLIRLQEWLEDKRQDQLVVGIALPRPQLRSEDATEEAIEKKEDLQLVFDALTRGLPEDLAVWDDDQRARHLLANLLDYFHREERVAWWEFYARRDAEVEDLRDERKALVELKFDRVLEAKRGIETQRFRFPSQEVSFHEGDELYDLHQVVPEGEKHRIIGTVRALDLIQGHIDIKKRKATRDLRPDVIHTHDKVFPGSLPVSLLGFGGSVAELGLHGDEEEYRTGRSLLLRRKPGEAAGGSLQVEGEDALTALVRIATELNGEVLAVQGPPGSGKSHNGARLIERLCGQGQRVGICAISHKVIRSLLEKTGEAAAEAGTTVHTLHHVSKDKARTLPQPRAGLEVRHDKVRALEVLGRSTVVGGTAWLWSGSDAQQSLDYLVIDEAGQMSLAHVLAVSRAARNLILLGDPQQLQQPQRGAHPDGAEISALSYLLDGRATIQPDQGIFLDRTYRLPPPICDFTSELYYDNRLHPMEHCEGQVVAGPSPFAGQGLFHVPVPHEDNQCSSPEEIDAIQHIVRSLTKGDHTWIDSAGVCHELTPQDVLIIAPYNVQVSNLIQRLPDFQIGTVDKFQGQEAPVVIYSLTSSTAHDAPRGMSFLYDPHRLNVATSRAQCVCIVVGSPALLEAECRTPAQMWWANGLCRYGERARVVGVSPENTAGSKVPN